MPIVLFANPNSPGPSEREGPRPVTSYDHIGNVVAVLDESGAVVAAYEYAPFGALVAQSGPEAAEVPFRFSTKYFDAETGLCYYGYRFYSPEMGRWMNRDPIEEEGGVGLHVFCENSPECFADVHGEHSVSLISHHGEIENGYVLVSFVADAWCIRPRNRPWNDAVANVLSVGMWGGFESIPLRLDLKSEQSVPCGGGYVVFRIFPRIGYPSEISKLKDFEIGNPLNGSIAGSPTGFPLDNDLPPAFSNPYGLGRIAGYDRTYVNKYPIYEYDNALFNLGWKYEHSGYYDGRPYADEDEKDHLFTQWGAMWHHPKGTDGSERVYVSCGDRVHFQMGNVGRYEIDVKFIITNYKSSRIID